MDDLLKVSSGTILAGVALMPGFLARTLAQEVASEGRNLSPWGELMRATWVALGFWALFLWPTGFQRIELTGLNVPRTIAWAFVALVVVTAGAVSWRLLLPKALRGLRARYPGYRWSAGDLSPWLVNLGRVTGDDSVTIWTKSGVVYYGTIFLRPTREEDGSLIVEVEAYGMRDKDAPHRATDLIELDIRRQPPQLVTLDRAEIAAIEVTDSMEHRKALAMKSAEAQRQEAERLAKERRQAKLRAEALRAPLTDQEYHAFLRHVREVVNGLNEPAKVQRFDRPRV